MSKARPMIVVLLALATTGLPSGPIGLPTSRADEPKVERFTVFEPKADGYASIRIPAILTTPGGTILAFAEGRAARADQSENELVLKRSTDGGRTWGPLAVIASERPKSLNNPCVVRDARKGRIWLMYQSYPGGIGERDERLTDGIEGDRIVRNHLIFSDDEGTTWSTPRDVTAATKRPQGVTTLASGPGVGIQLTRGPHAGRLIIPFNEGPWERWNVFAVFSDDGGETWNLGGTVPNNLIDNDKGGQVSTINEVQMVELEDGSIRYNARRWAGTPTRKTGISRDGGATWSGVEDVTDLSDPSCMASILRYGFATATSKGRILFSSPDGTRRANGTIHLSHDDGATWPINRVLEPGGFAYSCLTVLPDGDIGCLYETGNYASIVFARFPLAWLAPPNPDHFNPTNESGGVQPGRVESSGGHE